MRRKPCYPKGWPPASGNTAQDRTPLNVGEFDKLWRGASLIDEVDGDTFTTTPALPVATAGPTHVGFAETANIWTYNGPNIADYRQYAGLSIAMRFRTPKADTTNDQGYVSFHTTAPDTEPRNCLFSVYLTRAAPNLYRPTYFHENGAGVNNVAAFDAYLSGDEDVDAVIVRDAAGTQVKLFLYGNLVDTKTLANPPTGGTDSVLNWGVEQGGAGAVFAGERHVLGLRFDEITDDMAKSWCRSMSYRST